MQVYSHITPNTHTHAPRYSFKHFVAPSSPTNPCREFLKILASPAVFKAFVNFIQICSRVLTERNSHRMPIRLLKTAAWGCLTPPEITSLNWEADPIKLRQQQCGFACWVCFSGNLNVHSHAEFLTNVLHMQIQHIDISSTNIKTFECKTTRA